jgi:RHS repeat-associated protein
MTRLLILLLGLLPLHLALSQTQPAAVSASINGGAAQRSRVTSVSAVFDGDVGASLKPQDLVLRNLTAGIDIPEAAQAVTWDAATKTATWTFPTIANRALPQGNYIGVVRTPFTQPQGGLPCLADSPLPSDLVLGFHAYFGDHDGDRDVDFLDTCFLRDTWDLSAIAPRFDAAFDFNLDGSVNAADGPVFQNNYFTTFPPAAALYAQLKNDTGFSPRDGITSDPTIRGVLLHPQLATAFEARFQNGRAAFTDIRPHLRPDGSFDLPASTLNEINGSALGFADHRLLLRALDAGGAVLAAWEVPFTLHSRTNCPPFFTTSPVSAAATKIAEASLPADLSRWSVIQYEFNRQPDANWQRSADQTQITQRVNADASILLSDFDLINSSITGTWRVNTADDDDFMGFVFGFQNDRQYYLFDWKQADQTDSGAFAERGMTVKVVNSVNAITLADLYNTAGSAAVRPLFHNTVPWEDFVEYRFTINFRPGEFRILVSRADTNAVLMDTTIQDATFTSGRFGFYNFSQGELIYRGFNRQNVAQQTYSYDADAIDPDGDSLTYSIVRGPAGMAIHPTTGVISWAPGISQAGASDVTIAVDDGRGGRDEQTFSLSVVNYDTPPVVSLAATKYVINPGEPATVNVLATDDVAVSSVKLEINGVPTLLDDDGNAVVSSPQIGFLTAAATAVDSAGQTTVASVQIRVRDPNEIVPPGNGDSPDTPGGSIGTGSGSRPVVEITAPTTGAGLTSATDLVGTVDSPTNTLRDWKVQIAPAAAIDLNNVAADNAAYQLVSQGSQEVLASRVTTLDPTGLRDDLYFVRLIAFDQSGLGAVRGIFIRTGAVAGDDVPVVKITSPAPEACVSYLTTITGSITSTSNTLHSWRVEYAPAARVDLSNIGSNSTEWKQIASGTQPVVNGPLAVFDPTMLPNDPYVIRVVAYNRNGRGWAEPLPVSVCGDAKLGNFRLEFTDLQVPLVGIPITITRVYDTLHAGKEGEFGYGWKLGLQDGDIRETTPGTGGIFTDNPYRQGTRVYITTPEGRRVGFTFEAQPVAASFFGTAYKATFKPDPGVYEKLSVPEGESAFLNLQPDGTVGLFLFGFGWNPDTFILTTRDGTRYTYDQTAGLQNARDLNGNTVTFTPDGVRHSSGVSIPFTRDAQGRITEIKDPAGKVIKYTYDAAGDLRTVTDRTALVTTFDYRSKPAHYLEKVTDPLGRQAVRTEYGPDGRIVAVIDALGNRQEQNFDPANFIGTRTDARGNVTTLVYNPRGNVVEERDPEGGGKKFEYADPANPDKETAVIDPMGRRTSFAYDSLGNLTEQTDAAGNRTIVAYNALNKPTSVTNALQQTIILHYDPTGNLDEVVDSAGNKRQMARDAQGRVASVMDAEGNVTVFDYTSGCPCGRPGKVINPDGSFRLYEYNGFGQVTKETDETGVVTRSVYDEEGKLKYTEDAAGRRTTFTYRGQLEETVTNPLGHVTRTEYDDANRQSRIIDAEGGIVRFEYDPDGNRTKVIDPAGNVTTFVYDKAGRLKEEINALGHKRIHDYDAAGNRKESIDRNGRRRTFEYDALNRMESEKWWDKDGALIRTLSYKFNALGLQTIAEDPEARYDYSYDSLNRLRSVKSTVPGLPDFALTYGYDKNGQTTSVTDNYDVSVGSRYDSRNRLASRTWQGPGIDPVRVDFAYDKANRRSRLDRFIDLDAKQRVGYTENKYNSLGLLQSITHKGPTENVISSHIYDYDAANRITTWVIDGQNSTYTYDKTNQLVTADYATQSDESYTYDKNGNRTNPGYVTGKDNQLLADGVHTYSYDNEGNMVTRTHSGTGVVTSYEWDHRNRLVRVTDRNGVTVNQTVEFTFDAVNRRLSESVNSAMIRFSYNHLDPWVDFDNGSVAINRYMLGQDIDQLLSRKEISGNSEWYLTDGVGSVRAISGREGDLHAVTTYEAFGKAIKSPSSSNFDRFSFTGRELNAATGLYYYRARNYSGNLGRFITKDPIGFEAGDYNLYRYVENRPLSENDPLGLAVFGENGILQRINQAARTAVACTGRGILTSYLVIAVQWTFVEIGPTIGAPSKSLMGSVELAQKLREIAEDYFTRKREFEKLLKSAGPKCGPKGIDPLELLRRRKDQLVRETLKRFGT